MAGGVRTHGPPWPAPRLTLTLYTTACNLEKSFTFDNKKSFVTDRLANEQTDRQTNKHTHKGSIFCTNCRKTLNLNYNKICYYRNLNIINTLIKLM